MTTEDEQTLLQVADLWLNHDYSAFDIGQELSIPAEQVEVFIRAIDGVAVIVGRRTLKQIQAIIEEDKA